jgi:dephospho-CoA kinase
MITFGLTGGICCGKSRIRKLLQTYDIPMVDADDISRQVVSLGSKTHIKLFSTFGPEYFNYGGHLNRKKLADLVFSNDMARAKLESIMFPAITEEANIQIKKLHDAGHRLVGFDAPLIVEAGVADSYRPLIVVHCPPEMQIARMTRRDLLTHDEAVARLRAQLPNEAKIKVADFTIDSSGTVEETAAKAAEVINKIRSYL